MAILIMVKLCFSKGSSPYSGMGMDWTALAILGRMYRLLAVALSWLHSTSLFQTVFVNHAASALQRTKCPRRKKTVGWAVVQIIKPIVVSKILSSIVQFIHSIFVCSAHTEFSVSLWVFLSGHIISFRLLDRQRLRRPELLKWFEY
jgi:hypothetical protein